MKHNKDNEQFFLNAVCSGKISVFSDGRILNNKTNNVMGSVNRTGYIAIGMKDGRKVRHILAHRLVYLCCVGEIPDMMQVNHIDGVKTNNKVENLELVTNRQNCMHAMEIGLSHTPEHRAALSARMKGTISPFRSLSDIDATMVLKMHYEDNCGVRYLSRVFRVNHATISRILSGKKYANLHERFIAGLAQR